MFCRSAKYVAIEYGIPASTLQNWINSDRSDALQATVHLSASEVALIAENCTILLAADAKATNAKAIIELQKKMSRILKASKRLRQSN